jgi:hypothetical protein
VHGPLNRPPARRGQPAAANPRLLQPGGSAADSIGSDRTGSRTGLPEATISFASRRIRGGSDGRWPPSAWGLLGGCNPPTDFEASRVVMGAVDYVIQLQPAPPLVMTSRVAVPIPG